MDGARVHAPGKAPRVRRHLWPRVAVAGVVRTIAVERLHRVRRQRRLRVPPGRRRADRGRAVDRCEPGALACDVGELLLVEDPQPEHDDPEDHAHRDREDEREFGQGLASPSTSAPSVVRHREDTGSLEEEVATKGLQRSAEGRERHREDRVEPIADTNLDELALGAVQPIRCRRRSALRAAGGDARAGVVDRPALRIRVVVDAAPWSPGHRIRPVPPGRGIGQFRRLVAHRRPGRLVDGRVVDRRARRLRLYSAAATSAAFRAADSTVMPAAKSRPKSPTTNRMISMIGRISVNSTSD